MDGIGGRLAGGVCGRIYVESGTEFCDNHAMSTTLAGDVVKMEPMSEGIATPRKKKPKILAQINESCTGCAGSPVCIGYCPVAECMYWVPDEDHPPFGR